MREEVEAEAEEELQEAVSAGERVSRTKRRSERCVPRRKEQQSLTPISRNAISDQSEIEQAQLQLELG